MHSKDLGATFEKQNQIMRYAVIMAGGIGSRFWPMSTRQKPKQFIDILGTGESMIQATWRRLLPLFPLERILVVSHEDYRALCMEHLPDLKPENLLCEPSRKNTAPCLAYAAYLLQARDPESSMVVLAADHLISKETEFLAVLEKGLSFAEQQPALVTLGIRPHRPDTGYGYIQFNRESQTGIEGIQKVKTFTEKPNAELAMSFINSGDFLWNSGNFLWKTSTFIQAIEQHLPDEAALFQEAVPKLTGPEGSDEIRRIYAMVKNISVDYAILERADNVFVVSADIGWTDLGTWGSLREQSLRAGEANALVGGQILALESEGCLVHVPAGKKVVLQGAKNLLVVESNGVLLVCPVQDEQKIKEVVGTVRENWGDEVL